MQLLLDHFHQKNVVLLSRWRAGVITFFVCEKYDYVSFFSDFIILPKAAVNILSKIFRGSLS